MPELPEVETVSRYLAARVTGRVIEDVEVLDGRWCEPAPPQEIEDAIRGRTIQRVWRRGKYLVWELSDDVHLVMHLRMTGNVFLTASGSEPRPHTRVIWRLDEDKEVAFVDVRRFGTGVVLLGSDACDEYFASRLGVLAAHRAGR